MTFTQAIETCFRKYVDFSGRAPRSEYWFWVLFYCLCGLGTDIVDGTLSNDNYGKAGLLFMLATILPYLSVTVRRLHDTDRSGWWILIQLVPLIGIIISLVFFCQKGTSGFNRFGPDPLQSDFAT